MYRFIKIKFVEWRDQNAFAALQRVGNEAFAKRELVDQARHKANILRQQAEIRLQRNRINLSNPNVPRPRYVIEADEAEAEATRLETEAAPIQDMANRMSEQNTLASLAHARCGTVGYQVVDDKNSVVKVVDGDGTDLPKGEVYSYEVCDSAPLTPPWATPEWQKAIPVKGIPQTPIAQTSVS